MKATPVYDQLRDLRDAGLRDFMEKVMRTPFHELKPPQNGILFDGNVTSIVLHREGFYQVEMIIVRPGYEIPPHVHPEVDSYEIQFSGAMEFFVDHLQVGFVRQPRANGLHRDLMRWVPILADAPHYGMAGPNGAVFLSVQRWKVEPTHVGLNWRNV